MTNEQIAKLPEYTKKEMQQSAQNELNRIKKEESATIWETEALSQKLKEEASAIAPEEKEKLDTITDQMVGKDSLVKELSSEGQEALASIFSGDT